MMLTRLQLLLAELLWLLMLIKLHCCCGSCDRSQLAVAVWAFELLDKLH